MKPRRIEYSARELAFLTERKSMNRRVLHAAFVQEFGRTDVRYDHIKSLCTRNGWTTGRAGWSAENDAELRALYPDMPTAKVAERIGRTVLATYNRAQTLGVTKSEAYLASPAAGRTNGRQGMGTRFVKGQVPPNKGLRRPGWAPGRMRETQFKKGTRLGAARHNWKPIGSTRVVDGYEYTKVSDETCVVHTVNWKMTHVLRWVAVNGAVPKGQCLKCLDGNTRNTDPSNWMAIPRAMLPLLSGRHRLAYDDAPDELKPILLAIAQLQHASNTKDGLTATQRMIQKRKRSA